MRLAVWHYSVRFLQEARALFSKVGRATCRGDPTSVRVFVQILASVTGLAKFHMFYRNPFFIFFLRTLQYIYIADRLSRLSDRLKIEDDYRTILPKEVCFVCSVCLGHTEATFVWRMQTLPNGLERRPTEAHRIPIETCLPSGKLT